MTYFFISFSLWLSEQSPQTKNASIQYNIFTVLKNCYDVFRLQNDFCYIALPICNENFWLGDGEGNDK